MKKKKIRIISNAEARELFDAHENKTIEQAQKVIVDLLPKEFNSIISLSCSMGISAISIKDIVDILPPNSHPKVRELYIKAVKDLAMANGYQISTEFILVK